MQNSASIFRSKSIAFKLSAYGLAAALTLLAILLRWLMLPVLGPSTPFLLLAIVVSAWYGGLGPGLFATLLSGTVVFCFPELVRSSSLNFGAIPFVVSLTCIGIIISLLQESLHRAHRRLERSTRQLSESHRRFSLLVDSVKDYGIFMLDTEGCVVSWNAGAQQITGYTADDIIGRHFGCFYPAEDLALDKTEKELRCAADLGRYEEEGWRLRKDGTRFWASVLITAVHDENGELCGFSKVTRDMTERRQAEERARELEREQSARVEAEAASRAKDQFLSVVSHELRTPLNAILGWANLLRSGKLDERTTEMALETIERSSRVQSRLVEDLLDISRIMSGKMSIETQPIDLITVLDAALGQVRPNIEGKEIELVILPSSDGAMPQTDGDQRSQRSILVAGDEVRLEQVLTNLLSNAVKFTPAGGRITVTIREAGEHGEIVIEDDGEGINAEVLPHIFERFRQADSSQTRLHGGLGLGLAVARYVVEGHGGAITAQSDGAGQGAKFIVRLPLLPSWAGRHGSTSQKPAPSLRRPVTQQKK